MAGRRSAATILAVLCGAGGVAAEMSPAYAPYVGLWEFTATWGGSRTALGQLEVAPSGQCRIQRGQQPFRPWAACALQADGQLRFMTVHVNGQPMEVRVRLDRGVMGGVLVSPDDSHTTLGDFRRR